MLWQELRDTKARQGLCNPTLPPSPWNQLCLQLLTLLLLLPAGALAARSKGISFVILLSAEPCDKHRTARIYQACLAKGKLKWE